MDIAKHSNSKSNNRSNRKIRLVTALSAILVAVIACGFIYSSGLFRKGTVMLVISAKGKDLLSKPFEDIPDGTIPVEGVLGTTTVEIKQGRVHVLDSPCGNHICMHTGWISSPGQIIVCLPNQVIVRLVKQ